MNKTEKDTNVEDVTGNLSKKEVKRYWNMLIVLGILDIICFILLSLIMITYNCNKI